MTTDVYIGTRQVACRDLTGGRWQASAEDAEAGLALLQRHLAARRWWLRPRVRVWWSGRLCRPFVFEPPAGALAREDLEAVARALAPQRCALSEPCRIWVELLRPGLALAAAVAEATWERSLEVLGAGRPKAWAAPARAAPWWSLVLQQAAARQAWPQLSVRDCDSLTVLACDREGLTAASTYAPVFNDTDAQRVSLRMKPVLPAEAALLRVRMTLSDGAAREAHQDGRHAAIAHWGVLEP